MANSPYILIVFLISIFFTSCDNQNGLFGHSKTKEEAKANGSIVLEYAPDKTDFNLLDGTKLKIDTAWTEMSFTNKDGKRIIDTAYGYHFSIPLKKDNTGNFTFSFSLADTTNRVFTNGMDENMAQLCPRNLYDKMEILLEQKDRDTSKGWTHPIITDTIEFTKIK